MTLLRNTLICASAAISTGAITWALNWGQMDQDALLAWAWMWIAASVFGIILVMGLVRR